MKKNACLIPLYVWTAVFVLLPLAIVIYFAFTREGGTGMEFSLEGFSRLSDPMYLGVILKSFKIAIISTLVCILCGYPAAYILARSKSRAKFIIVILMLLPMWMNFLLRTYAWMSILETNSGFLNKFLGLLGFEPVHIMYTQGAVILGMVYNYIPYMILPLYTIMLKIDNRLIEAAQDLGCNTFNVFRKVIIPLSFPGITSGITMTFVPAVSTFVISQLLGGPKNNLIGDLIESQFVSGGEYNPYYGSAISLLLMVVVFICIGIFNQFDNEEMEETLK